MSKPLAKAVSVGTSAVALTLLGAASAFAGATGAPSGPLQLPTPTTSIVHVAAASCVDGALNAGVLTVDPVANAQVRIDGEIGSSITGVGVHSVSVLANSGYTFQSGQMVEITPSPDLGSVQNCTPARPPQATITPSGAVEGEGTFTYTVNSTKTVYFAPFVNGLQYDRGITLSSSTGSQSLTFPYAGLKGGDVVTIMADGVEVARLVLPSFAPVLKEVTPLAPTVTDHTITIPSVEGVIYTKADGTILPAGTWGVGSAKVGLFTPNPDGSFPVLAKSADDKVYVLVGLAHYNWPFVFNRPTPVPPPVNEPPAPVVVPDPIVDQPAPQPAPAEPETPAVPVSPAVPAPAAPAAPVAPLAPAAATPQAQADMPVSVTSPAPSTQTDQGGGAALPSNYIADAHTAAGDDLMVWLMLLVVGLMMVVAPFYKKVLRRS